MTASLVKDNPLQTTVTVSAVALSPEPVVLVVDDHEDTRELLRYVLETHRYRVFEATDGEEAVSFAEKICPDLVLMDSNLKYVDGIEATRRIRELPSMHDLPIIFLSGHAQPQARAAAFASGANDYLVKPVCLEELERVVERQISRRRQRMPG